LGVDTNAFVPYVKTSDGGRSFNVISVARLAPEKAQHLLIEAIAKLAKEGRDVHLQLVGDGPDRSVLERQIFEFGLSNAVSLKGALNQDELKVLYRDSDAFALASLAEGLPVVLMEAMAMEIPCVATRITGIPELIEDDVDGLLVEASNADQLAAAIARLMDDPDLRERIAKSGRRKVMEHYSLSQNVLSLSEVFKQRLVAAPNQTRFGQAGVR
jgi:glycosyltransferase involved in cell wall biosynthesis